ncbi:MAG: VRR-NUC domain-containing protein [Oscillospiraceae bacterium]|nr:VRR-NUC domain-containing protein [Oscillospiraceae bacterium]
MTPKDKRLLPKEGQEQATLMNWAKMQSWRWPEIALLFHIPNGGGRSKAEAGRFKAEGVKAGVPDLFLPVPRGEYHGLFIELKRQAGGRVSAEQKEWIEKLRDQGYRVEVCRGWEAAAELLREYLGLEVTNTDKYDVVWGGFVTIDASARLEPGPDPRTLIGVNRG